MLSIHDFTVGDTVLFGRTRGEKTRGTVVKVNRKNLKVRQDEARGTMRSYRVGTVWTVPPSLCSKVGGSEASTPATPTATYKAGTTVEFRGAWWAARGEGTLTGVVTRGGTNPEVYAEGRFHSPDTMTVVAKRDLDTITRECLSVYGGLSPENLTCDGELSRSAVRAKSARLNRALKALWKEAGREITEGEAWKSARY